MMETDDSLSPTKSASTNNNNVDLDSSNDQLVIDMPNESTDKTAVSSDDAEDGEIRDTDDAPVAVMVTDNKTLLVGKTEEPDIKPPALVAAVEEPVMKQEPSTSTLQPFPPPLSTSTNVKTERDLLAPKVPTSNNTTPNKSTAKSSRSHGKSKALTPKGQAADTQSSSSASPRRTHKKRTTQRNADTEPDPKIARTSNVQRRDAGTWVRSVATEVESESLGPCEPGTHVNLDGVVWNETPAGILVVNVTWRGKSYVGTLLDCTRYDWAPPRLCESPLLELTPAKGRTGKRGGRSGNNSQSTSNNNNISQLELRRCNSSTSAISALSQKSKANKLSIAIPANGHDDEDSSQSGCNSASALAESILEPMSPVLQQCPCSSCNKQFASSVALKFHQNSAHRPATPPEPEPRKLAAASTKRSPRSARSSPRRSGDSNKNDQKLSLEEKESLQQLFRVVDSNGARVAPKLEHPSPTHKKDKAEHHERSTASRSPGAYSDISDDAAPVLEKEVPTPSLNSRSTPGTTNTTGSSSALKPTGSGAKSVAVVQPQQSSNTRHTPPVAATCAASTSAGGNDKASTSEGDSSAAAMSPRILKATGDGVAAGTESMTKTHGTAGTHMVAAMGMPRVSMTPIMAHPPPPANPSPFGPPSFMPPSFMPYGSMPAMIMPMMPQPSISAAPHPGTSVVSSPSAAACSPQTSSTSASAAAAAAQQHKIHELKCSTSISTQTSTNNTKPTRTDTPPVQRHVHMHQHVPYSFHPFSNPAEQYAFSVLASQQAAINNIPQPK